jgi:MFS family permease
MTDERTPTEIREGVRSGIRAVLTEDVERRGGRTAGRLAAAGAIGVVGALGSTLFLSGHPFDHHPSWHVLFFVAVCAGLLVVSVALMLLEVATPALPLARAASVGVLGLGIAGICGALCPDPHFLRWWTASAAGGRAADLGGLALSAASFGLATTLFVGGVAAFAALRRGAAMRMGALLPTAMLLLLLSPAIALQSVSTSWQVFAGWLIGASAGGYLGVAGGIRLRARVGRS